jgi:hypothetical protein
VSTLLHLWYLYAESQSYGTAESYDPYVRDQRPELSRLAREKIAADNHVAWAEQGPVGGYINHATAAGTQHPVHSVNRAVKPPPPPEVTDLSAQERVTAHPAGLLDSPAITDGDLSHMSPMGGYDDSSSDDGGAITAAQLEQFKRDLHLSESEDDDER